MSLLQAEMRLTERRDSGVGGAIDEGPAGRRVRLVAVRLQAAFRQGRTMTFNAWRRSMSR